jgi:hypothetical protein
MKNLLIVTAAALASAVTATPGAAASQINTQAAQPENDVSFTTHIPFSGIDYPFTNEYTHVGGRFAVTNAFQLNKIMLNVTTTKKGAPDTVGTVGLGFGTYDPQTRAYSPLFFQKVLSPVEGGLSFSTPTIFDLSAYHLILQAGKEYAVFASPTADSDVHVRVGTSRRAVGGGTYSGLQSAVIQNGVARDITQGRLTIGYEGSSHFTLPPASNVPEPATWVGLTLGLGIMGARLRRERKAAAPKPL